MPLDGSTTTPPPTCSTLEHRMKNCLSLHGKQELNMKSEIDRCSTFETWPVNFLNKERMAAAGFYYLKTTDLVQCAFCNIKIGSWEEGDDPLKDHWRWSPTCPFLRGVCCGNIPQGESLISLPITDACTDVCGPYELELRPHSSPEGELQKDNFLTISRIQRPCSPEYLPLDYRKKTFETWPLSLKQRPEQLSEAGFYYTGKGDNTVCFHCGGKLMNWLETDEPWVEHAKWYPQCLYVLLKKGGEFIRDVQEGKFEARNVIENDPSLSSHSQEVPEEKKRSIVDESRLCKICFVEELGVVFLPCGHIVACAKCALSLTNCAICRKPFSAFVRALLS